MPDDRSNGLVPWCGVSFREGLGFDRPDERALAVGVRVHITRVTLRERALEFRVCGRVLRVGSQPVPERQVTSLPFAAGFTNMDVEALAVGVVEALEVLVRVVPRIHGPPESRRD